MQHWSIPWPPNKSLAYKRLPRRVLQHAHNQSLQNAPSVNVTAYETVVRDNIQDSMFEDVCVFVYVSVLICSLMAFGNVLGEDTKLACWGAPIRPRQ